MSNSNVNSQDIEPLYSLRLDKECFPVLMKYIIRTGRAVGLMPSNRVQKIWSSILIFINAALLVGSVQNMTANQDAQPTKTGHYLDLIVFMVSHVVILCSQVMFWKIGKEWTNLTDMWIKAHRKLSMWSAPPRISVRMFVTTLFITMALMSSYLLYTLDHFPRHCISKYFGNINASLTVEVNPYTCIVTFYTRTNPLIRLTGGFSGVFVPLLWIVETIIILVLSYRDLFLILVSIGLTNRYKQLNKWVEDTVREHHQEKGQCFNRWSIIRDCFAAQADLVSLADEILSPLMLLTFSSNLFTIGYFMLHELSAGEGMEKVRIVYLFCFYFIKTMYICMTAADINENCDKCLVHTYLCSTEDYNVEVERLQTQIISQEVALTGMHFFVFTRKFLLAVIGGILTFEVFFLQFEAANWLN